MDIIRYAALKTSRWSNGGGITRVLASSGETNPAWRVSIAEVSKAGPFSEFSGMDRVLTVISGEMVLLRVDGVDHPLEKYRPYKFSGDSDSSASLPTGEILDLNVMTRRGEFKGFTTILELSKKRPHPVFEGQYAVLLEGSAKVAEAAGAARVDAVSTSASESTSAPTVAAEVELGLYDAVVGSAAAPEISGRGFLAVVTIEPV